MTELLSVTDWHWIGEASSRLLFAVGAGALVGIEREYHGRPAGFRTHILVALGAAVVALISVQLPELTAGKEAMTRIQVDPGRIASGVVTGIGFLGAGAIIRIGITARGLTTAASLWCMASVGMGFGFGLYALSVVGTLLMLFTLFVLGGVERKLSKHWYKSVDVTMIGPDHSAGAVVDLVKQQGWRIIDLKLEKQKTEHRLDVEFEVRLNSKKDVERLVSVLNRADFIERFRVS